MFFRIVKLYIQIHAFYIFNEICASRLFTLKKISPLPKAEGVVRTGFLIVVSEMPSYNHQYLHSEH